MSASHNENFTNKYENMSFLFFGTLFTYRYKQFISNKQGGFMYNVSIVDLLSNFDNYYEQSANKYKYTNPNSKNVRVRKKEDCTILHFDLAVYSKEDVSIKYSEEDDGFYINGEIKSEKKKESVSLKSFKYFYEWKQKYENTIIETSLENGLLEIKLSRKPKKSKEFTIDIKG